MYLYSAQFLIWIAIWLCVSGRIWANSFANALVSSTCCVRTASWPFAKASLLLWFHISPDITVKLLGIFVLMHSFLFCALSPFLSSQTPNALPGYSLARFRLLRVAFGMSWALQRLKWNWFCHWDYWRKCAQLKWNIFFYSFVGK